VAPRWAIAQSIDLIVHTAFKHCRLVETIVRVERLVKDRYQPAAV